MATAPASALTLDVGVPAIPIGPISVPPVSASLGVGGASGTSAAVDAGGSTGTTVNVTADPSGLHTKASSPLTPPIDLSVGTPSVPGATLAPVATSAPVITPAPTASPTTQHPRPADPRPNAISGPTSPAASSTATRLGSAISAAASRSASASRDATDSGASRMSASIAAGPHSGLIAALRANGARVALWLALVGLALAVRLFVNSALKNSVPKGSSATRAARGELTGVGAADDGDTMTPRTALTSPWTTK